MKDRSKYALASVALLLALSAADASATTLTSSAGTPFTGTFEAVDEGEVTLTGPFGFGTVSCDSSVILAKVASHGTSVTAGLTISAMSLTACLGGEPTSPLSKPGSLEIHGTSTTGSGTLTSLNLHLLVHKTLIGTCTFTTSSSGTDLGTLTGSNITKGYAVIDLAATIPSTCGSAALEGRYVIRSPSTLEVH
jgi:hypothetical protein